MTDVSTRPKPPPQLDADLLASRPRVRRDVLYTEVPDGVLFHDAASGFRMHGRSAYRFATLVVPYLDGGSTVADLCSGLGPQQRAMVADLVRTLYRRGFARAVPAADPHREPVLPEAVRRRFDAQVAYVDHHVDDAETRFARFRDTRVAIVGDDEVAGWAARSLLRNGTAHLGVSPGLLDEALRREADELRGDGCPVDLRGEVDAGSLAATAGGSPGWAALAGYDVVVVTPGAREPRTLMTLLEQGVPEGRVLLPCWTAGDEVLVGPSMRAGTTGCWLCAALRVAATTDPGAAAELWSGLAPHRLRARAVSGPVAAMVGNLLGYEIFRLTTGALPGETDGGVVVQDLESLDAAVEPLLPHPACGLCPGRDDHQGRRTRGAAASLAGEAATAQPPQVAVPSTSPQTWQPVPEPGGPVAEEQLATLERRMAIVGSRLGVVTGFDDDLLPQVPLRVTTAHVALGHGRRRRVAAVDVHNVAAARVAALAAAAGLYADRVVPTDVLAGPTAAHATRGLTRVPPGALATHSGVDPEGTTVAAWARARSLTTGRELLVPAAAVAPHGEHDPALAFTPGPAGTGVDGSPEEARGAALLSALAHDAVVGAVHGRLTPTRLLLAERDDDPVLTFLVRTAAHLDVRPELVDLGAALPAPVVLARCPDPRSGEHLWTVAADTTRRAATVTVLRDLLGRIQLAAALPDGETVDAGDPLVSDLAAETIAVRGQQPWTDRTVTLREVLDRLRSDGVEPLVVDRWSADLARAGLSVARVLLARGSDGR